jgi:small nuclear ribonucleoprotein (snRNP)-like protein
MKPFDVLSSSIGKKVTVIFKNGSEQEGKLKNFDNYINITLETEDTKEIVIKGSKISLIVLQSEILYTRTSEK